MSSVVISVQHASHTRLLSQPPYNLHNTQNVLCRNTRTTCTSSSIVTPLQPAHLTTRLLSKYPCNLNNDTFSIVTPVQPTHRTTHHMRQHPYSLHNAQILCRKHSTTCTPHYTFSVVPNRLGKYRLVQELIPIQTSH